ncbi:MAG: PP2C family protein-serine/threonine phosphatase [Clostridia bacterium]|nr:PP2C family protein-serine/threonine phosphatase [Clostridia bacterium]
MAEKTGRKKNWISLSVKLNSVIMVLVMILASGLAAIAYYVNGERVDRFFKENTAEEALAIAYFMDGDVVEKLLTAVESEDFQAMHEKAEETDDEAAVTDWLKTAGLYDNFAALNETLGSYRDNLNAKSIYIQSVKGNRGINLVDPSENMLYIGSIEISADEFDAYQTNEHIDPTVSTTEFGWLCSAYEPIYTSDGRAVALLGIDIDMNDVMRERQQFLRIMLFFAAMLMIVAVLLSIRVMRRMATKPLSMLSKAVDGFADAKGGYTKEDIISLPIHSQDEIGDLYKEIRSMQGRMVEYLDNLTLVTAEKERISTELNVATQIQAEMLPRVFPPFPDRHEFDIYASMDPAKEVGGDFYDFFLVDHDHLALVIADVSGKGVPAALVMVITKALIKNRLTMGDTPGEALQSVNEQMCEGNETGHFVTVWLALLDLRTGQGVAANAGHEHPVIRRKDGQYELVVYRHSPAIAVIEGIRFKEHTFEMQPGDTLFVYTDGVPEATNSQNVLFGTDRMVEVLNRNPDAGPEKQLGEMKTAIDEFVGEAPQFDDITMLCLKYNGEERA